MGIALVAFHEKTGKQESVSLPSPSPHLYFLTLLTVVSSRLPWRIRPRRLLRSASCGISRSMRPWHALTSHSLIRIVRCD